MARIQLDHFSIRTTDVTGTRDFYVHVLGLTDGERPPFKFPGAWLYSGDRAVVHVIGVGPSDNEGLADYLGKKDEASRQGTGAVDHLAFMAKDIDEMRDRLQRAGIPSREREVPLLGLRQIFIEDPNGVTIELNFPQP
jgi:catechol 2,3-dioxygenase-like lactoylglutathione lyase family enzyme